MLKPGDSAPDFRLPSTAGREVSLRDLRGRKVVVYFYPKDNTPGCTREACDFRDHLARLRRAGTAVVGVSKDSLSSHERFREKYDLPFDLLSDPDSTVAASYGVYGEKTMYGRKVMGTIRSTFLVDETGRIEAVWSPVKVDGHVDQVLATLKTGAAPDKDKIRPRKARKKKPTAKKKTPRLRAVKAQTKKRTKKK